MKRHPPLLRLLSAILLTLALFGNSLIWAAEEPLSVDETLELSFDQVEALMRKNSPTLKANAANREVTLYIRTQLANQSSLTEGSMRGVSDLMNYLRSMREGLDIAFAGQNPATITGSDWALKSSVDALASIVGGQVGAQLTQLTQTSRDFAQGGELSATIDQLYDADLQTIYGALALYQGYFNAERNLALLLEERNLLQMQRDAAQSQLELGLSTSLPVQELDARLAAQEVALELAIIEQAAYLAELNLQLGRSATEILKLQPLPQPDLELLSSLERESAWQAAYRESYTLQAKKHIQGSLQQQLDETKRLYGDGGDRYHRSEQELEAAKLVTNLTAEQQRVRFNSVYEQLQLQTRACRLEEARQKVSDLTLEHARQKNEAGYISDMELAQIAYQHLQQQHHLQQTREELQLAYQRWLLVQKGMSLP